MPPCRDILVARKRLNGKRAREALAAALRAARQNDAGRSEFTYVLNRGLSDAPFREWLLASLNARLKSVNGPISVLDKGAGKGRMLAELKRISPKRISATALSASRTVSTRNARHFEGVVLGSGINAKLNSKFDIIYDCFGEDYHLPKKLFGKSLSRSVSLLKEGGVLFTILPLTFKSTPFSFTPQEGKEFLRVFRRKNPGLKIIPKFIPKRISFFEYIDLILEIRA
jgi:SAM-dependent methyltransferase